MGMGRLGARLQMKMKHDDTKTMPTMYGNENENGRTVKRIWIRQSSWDRINVRELKPYTG